VGLRDAEREHYDGYGHNFSSNEATYRKGFEAALHKEFRGKTARECVDKLREMYGQCCEDDAFHHGYNRGQEYHEHLQNRDR